MCRPVISSVILRVSSSVNSVKFPYGLIYNFEIFYMQYVLDMRISKCRGYTQKCKKVLELYTWTDQCDQHQWASQSLTNDIVVLLPKMSLAHIFVHVPALLIGTFPISSLILLSNLSKHYHINMCNTVVRTNYQNTSQWLDFGTG